MTTQNTTTDDGQDEPVNDGPVVSRRGLMRAGAGAAAVGIGASALPGDYSPVGDAEAIAPAIAVAGAAAAGTTGIGAGVAAGWGGARVYDRFFGDEPAEDADAVREAQDDFAAQNKYTAARSLEINGEQQRRSIAETHGYEYDLDSVTGIDSDLDEGQYLGDGIPYDETAFHRMMWDAVRAATTDGIAENQDTAAIEAATIEEVDRRFERFRLEMAEAWNSSVDALAPVLAAALEDQDEVIYSTTPGSSSGYVESQLQSIDEDDLDADAEIVARTEGENEDIVIARTYVDTSLPLYEIEGYDEGDVEDIGGGETTRIPVLFVGTYGGTTTALYRVAPEFEGIGNTTQLGVWAEDPEGTFDDVLSLDKRLIDAALDNARAVRDSIKADIPEYVQATVSSTDAGEITADDLQGPGDIIGDDAVNEGDAVTRQLAAQGITAADAQQMTINHPDVGEATGMLFASLSDPVGVGVGETIPAGSIERAYFIEDADEDETTVLDPSEPIEIVDIPREDITVDGEFVDVDDDDNEFVQIVTGTDIDDVDGGYVVTVEYEDPDGVAGEFEQPVRNWSAASEDGTEWVVGTPPDDDVAVVTDVDVEGAVVGSPRVDAPADPTAGEDLQGTVEQYQEQQREMQDTIDELEALLDEQGGGFFPGGDGPGTAGIVAGIAALLGFGWLLQN